MNMLRLMGCKQRWNDTVRCVMYCCFWVFVASFVTVNWNIIWETESNFLKLAISAVTFTFHTFLSSRTGIMSGNIACLVHQSSSGQAPAYLADIINLVTDIGHHLLRSAVNKTCVIPHRHNIYHAAGPYVLQLTITSVISAVDNSDDSWIKVCLGINWSWCIVIAVSNVL